MIAARGKIKTGCEVHRPAFSMKRSLLLLDHPVLRNPAAIPLIVK
jgi:hypothetical protein